ncbi:transglutaminase-like domain-containing protein [Pedobacter sp. AW31-3R]|uniref:transglutaminase-like domain-containing protein n=1 Tax=Pedobacter sp. AW31-3R TaxID=3445781 RepID=UPI003FA14F61
MKFEVSAKLAYETWIPSTLILNIEPFQSSGQQVLKEEFSSSNEVKINNAYSITPGEKRIKVIEIPDAGKISFLYKAEVENKFDIIPTEKLYDVPITQMPFSVLSYLHPSRYCQSDKLYKFAFNKFGKIDHAYEKVMAICDWIYSNVEYAGGYTTAQTSANDTITEQVGVCRDFAHLGIALCRAMTIPARYFTGYAYQLKPQDFHACFEVYLGGRWVIMDATKLVPLTGLIKIATGIDATDTALASIFGNIQFRSMEVGVTLLGNEFQDVQQGQELQAYSYV